MVIIVAVITQAGYTQQPWYASRILPRAALPASCNPGNGEVTFLTTTAELYECTAVNTWTRLIRDGTASFTMNNVAAGGFVVNGFGGAVAPAQFFSTGDESIASFIRTDAGHAHIFIGSMLNDADFGLGAAGEIHLDSIGNFEINIRRGGNDEWVFGTDNSIRFVNGTLFGALGAPANGRITYCPDCAIANPCAGGGTGALAKRLNGAWVCN